MSAARYPRSDERLNAATHALGAVLGSVGLGFLIIQSAGLGHTGVLLAVIIYGTAMVALFVFSAIHHALIAPRLKQVFLALDHCGIYLLIAGTYTPFALLMPPGQEWTLLAFVWGIAAVGITLQVAAFLLSRSDAYEKFAFVLYLAMG